MKKTALLLTLLLSACTTINVTSDGDVVIDAHKAVTTNADASL